MHFVGATPEFVQVSRLPLEVGQKLYPVQASGLLGLQAGVMMRMRLEVRSFFGLCLPGRRRTTSTRISSSCSWWPQTYPPKAEREAEVRRCHLGLLRTS